MITAIGMMLISAMAAVRRVAIECGPGVHHRMALSTSARARARTGVGTLVAIYSWSGNPVNESVAMLAAATAAKIQEVASRLCHGI